MNWMVFVLGLVFIVSIASAHKNNVRRKMIADMLEQGLDGDEIAAVMRAIDGYEDDDSF